jgi:hypothetical protein
MQQWGNFTFMKQLERKGELGNEISFETVCPFPLSSDEMLKVFKKLRKEHAIDHSEYGVQQFTSTSNPF